MVKKSLKEHLAEIPSKFRDAVWVKDKIVSVIVAIVLLTALSLGVIVDQNLWLTIFRLLLLGCLLVVADSVLTWWISGTAKGNARWSQVVLLLLILLATTYFLAENLIKAGIHCVGC